MRRTLPETCFHQTFHRGNRVKIFLARRSVYDKSHTPITPSSSVFQGSIKVVLKVISYLFSIVKLCAGRWYERFYGLCEYLVKMCPVTADKFEYSIPANPKIFSYRKMPKFLAAKIDIILVFESSLVDILRSTRMFFFVFYANRFHELGGNLVQFLITFDFIK